MKFGVRSSEFVVGEILEWATNELKSVGVSIAELDAQLLLAHTLKVPRTEFFLNLDRVLTEKESTLYKELVKKRSQRIPLQYITGEAAFRYLTLKVTPDVLIPRPETECVAEEVIRLARSLTRLPKSGGQEEPKVLDIGTGSGAIALSVAYEVEEAEVMATDISREALAVARLNARRYHLQSRVRFIQSDLFTNLPAKFKGYFDIIVSNPPYVLLSQLDQLEPEVSWYEPALALSSSQDGLYLHHLIAREAPTYLKAQGHLIMEIDSRSNKKALKLLKSLQAYEDIKIVKDLSGHDRIIEACFIHRKRDGSLFCG